MAQHKTLQINIPMTFDQHWAERYTNQLAQNLWKVIVREDKKLRKELDALGRGIYREIIQQYYASYTPKYYDRHGDLAGVNLYKANNVDFKKGHVGDRVYVKPMASRLDAYQKKQKITPFKLKQFVLNKVVLAGRRRMRDGFIGFKATHIGVIGANGIDYMSGKPQDILKAAGPHLEAYYRSEIRKRIKESFKSIKRVWVK